jgi:predicted NUDIX family NTP pyrophosphohydrolase
LARNGGAEFIPHRRRTDYPSFMPKISGGLLMYRVRRGALQVLLVHPGGPYVQNKDEGAWSVPKGEPGAGEELFDAAQREFKEETGLKAAPPFIELSPITQKGGKVVHAWAFAGDCDPVQLRSNNFTLEWPPRSGRMQEFPEIDRADWFDVETARRKIKAAQFPLIEELSRLLK